MPQTSPKKEPRKRPKNTPINDLVETVERNPNLTTRELGKIHGIDHTAVIRLFQRHGITRENVEAFKKERADYLAGLQEVVLSGITQDDIKKASLRDKVIAAATLYDKERLERGQSTSNQSVFFHIVQESCGAGDTISSSADPEKVSDDK